MKDLYIPKGKTLTTGCVDADTIIVKGTLNVEGAINARRIVGNGVICAGRISAKSIIASVLDAGAIIAERVAADRVVVLELYASRAVIVTCYLEAALVDTPKVTVSRLSVDELRAKRAVYLPDKNGGMLCTVLASQIRSFWAALRGWWSPKTVPGLVDAEVSDDVQDADFIEAETTEAPRVDFERRRILALYDLMKDSGYVLRLVPVEDAASTKAGKHLDAERGRLKAA